MPHCNANVWTQNCSTWNDDQFWNHSYIRVTILTIKGCTGAISLVAVTVSLILFFLFRRYKKEHLPEIVVTERLILYSAVAGLVRSVVVMLQLTGIGYIDDNGDGTLIVKVCKAIGFLDQLSTWGVLLTTQMIMMHLFIQLTFGMEASNKRVIEVIFYIGFPVLFPLTFSWAPFLWTDDGYRMSGAWCWICRFDYQIIFWFGPLIICQAIDSIFLSIVYPILFFKKIRKEERRDLIKQHAPLLLSLLLAVLVNLVVLGNRLTFKVITICYSGNIKTGYKLSVWILHAIACSCWGVVSAIVIMLYLWALYRTEPQVRYGRHLDSSHSGRWTNTQSSSYSSLTSSFELCRSQLQD